MLHLLTCAQNTITSHTVLPLPQEPFLYYGFQKKRYAALVMRQKIAHSKSEWVFINIHLTTLDKVGILRKLQTKTIFDFAQQEFKKGNFVVIGGDWNMKISPTIFPHTSLPKNQFWTQDFPMEDLPNGWKFAVDETVPTTRTQEMPYIKGETFTTIIDGFVISPNVSLLEVQAIDKNFAYTDHHPVIARFRAETA